jgi:aromatic ring hydroxylase
VELVGLRTPEQYLASLRDDRTLAGRDGYQSRAGHDGELRLRALWMASDLTTGALGGYHAVLAAYAVHAVSPASTPIDRRR